MDESSIDWSHFSTDLLVPSVQLRTARSCAYKCAFCRYPILAGDLNLTSLDVVERELTYLKEIGVTHLLFIDDTFNIPKNRFKDLCRMMINRKFDFKWYSYFRCANADDEVFDLAARSGCTGVFLGIESGDNRMLKEMYKTATIEKYKYGLTKLREYGIFSYASFIVGFPGETEESAENTLRFIDEAQPTFYCLESYFHDKKVPIALRAEEFGLTGSSYAWKHDTMDWRRASEIVASGYHRITGSIPVPLYCFDLWTIGYLMGQGLSRGVHREIPAHRSRDAALRHGRRKPGVGGLRGGVWSRRCASRASASPRKLRQASWRRDGPSEPQYRSVSHHWPILRPLGAPASLPAHQENGPKARPPGKGRRRGAREEVPSKSRGDWSLPPPTLTPRPPLPTALPVPRERGRACKDIHSGSPLPGGCECGWERGQG